MKKIVVLILIFLFLSSSFISVASAQNVEAEITKKSFDGENYIIKGHIALSELNPEGQMPESDDVVIVMDIIEEDGKFPLLPESMYIRPPGECETPYTLNGKCLTNEEYYGKNCKTVSLWSWYVRQDAWRAGAGTGPNGGFSYDASKVQSQYDTDFEIKIPKEYADKTIRIRVDLTHRWGGPFANWPAFSFHHEVLYSGTLKDIVSSGPKESPTEVMKKIQDIVINTINKLKNRKDAKDKEKEDKGMHIFPESKIKQIDEKAKEQMEKNEEKIKKIAEKNEVEVIKIKKADGTEKTKVKIDQEPGFWDKVKYYGSKFAGKVASEIPGIKYVSNKAEDWTTKVSGLDPGKKTQLALGVDPLAAGLYNKFNRYEDAEKKYSTVKTFITTVGSTLAKPVSYVLDKLGCSAKQLTASAYEAEYKAVLKRVKDENGQTAVVRKDIVNDGEITHKWIFNPSTTASNGSKGTFKLPEKRFDYYVELAKKRGELP